MLKIGFCFCTSYILFLIYLFLSNRKRNGDYDYIFHILDTKLSKVAVVLSLCALTKLEMLLKLGLLAS